MALNIKEVFLVETYTPQEVAEILGRSATTIREYLRIGKLKGFKEKGRYRVTEEQLEEFKEKRDG